MSDFLVVAFYTKNTPYEDEIENLRKSCQEHDIPLFVKPYNNRGEWVFNAGIKPEFLYWCLVNFKQDIVYVDADAVFEKYPEYFSTFTGDIGVHYLHERELLSGTIFLRNNDRVKSIVKSWIERQHQEPTTWDQKTLHSILQKCGDSVEVVNIPPEYCKIFDTMKNVPDTVILHTQASRRHKQPVRERSKIPDELDGIKVRRAHDGSFWIPRPCSKDTEKKMDTKYIRVKGAYRWYAHMLLFRPFESLYHIFQGKIVNIVGKGPSLDKLTINDLSIWRPCIAINDAIHKVESLFDDCIAGHVFAIQQDIGLMNTCQPKYGSIIVSHHASAQYENFTRKYTYYPEELQCQRRSLTVECAIELCKLLDVKGFNLISFDACVNKKVAYAECIGYSATKGGDPSRFLKHRKKIDARLRGIPTEWTLPE